MLTMSNLAIGQAAATATAIYTNAARRTALKLITLHNTNTSIETIKIYRVPNATGAVGSPVAGNKFFQLDIKPLDTLTLEFPGQGWVLESVNDAIFLESTTASKVNFALDGSLL